MKKVWIAIAGVIAVLAVALLVISLASPKETIESGDGDSSYPYAYERTKDGLLLRITGAFPEASRWIVADSGGAAAAAEKKQDAEKAEFLITSAGSGSGSVRLALQRETDGLTEQLYQITVELVSALDGELTVLRNYHGEAGAVAEGAGDGFSYRVAPQSDGTLAILLECAQETEWDIEVDGESVSVSYEALSEEKRLYSVRYQSLGQSSVFLCCRESAQAIELYVTTNLNEQVQLLESAVVDHVYTEHFTQAEQFNALFGTFALPPEAKDEMRSTEEWVSRADGVTRLRSGCVRFLLDSISWSLYISREGSAEDYIAGCAKISLERSTASVNGISVEGYFYEGGAAAAWTDAQGRHCMLKGDDVTPEELFGAAEKMIGGMAVG